MGSKILVVDDDENTLYVLEQMLVQKGYEVLTARNGIDGLKLAVQEVPDLVVLDVMMPGLDGFEVCRRLRHGPNTAQIPVLLLSGVDRDDGFKICADDYLVKPIKKLQFLTTVEKLLAQKIGNPDKNQERGRKSKK